jgi:hypothetical protein
MAQRWPDDLTIKFLVAESRLLDFKDPRGALAALAAIAVAPSDARNSVRKGLLTVDAYTAAGQPDSARYVFEALAREFPNSSRVRERLSPP